MELLLTDSKGFEPCCNTTCGALPGKYTYISYDSKIDTDGFQSLAVTVMGERILESTAGCIISLASIPKDSTERAEHDEEVEVRREVLVEIPCPLNFGRVD